MCPKADHKLDNLSTLDLVSSVKLSNDDMLRAMDINLSNVLVLVKHKDQDSSQHVEVKKLRRLRNAWTVKVMNSKITMETIPPKDKALEVVGIFSLGGDQLSSVASEKLEEEEVLEDIKYWYGDQLEPQRNQSEGFWVRQGVSPTLPESDAGTWQRMLQKWEKKGEEELSKMVLRGLAKTTRQGHRSALNWLAKADPPPKGISVANWILRLFEIKGAKWAGATLAKEMASMQGALANLPVYRKDAAPMLLKVSAEWRMGLKGAGVTARQRKPDQAKIASWEIMKKAIRMEKNPLVQVALEVMWVTAGRGSDITKLIASEIAANKTQTKVRFIGKTANSQPYTVSSAPISMNARKFIAERKLAKKEKGEEQVWLFPKLEVDHLLQALRRADPLLGTRSVRRGALQALAATGLTDMELLAYSQHRNVQTLRRYLDFGWESGEVEERCRKAAGLALKL